MLHDDVVNQNVDRYLVQRFLTAAAVSAKKSRRYAVDAENARVRRHFEVMAEANDNAKKQLENVLSSVMK